MDLCVPIVPIPDLKRSLGLPAPIGGDANAGIAELGSGIPSRLKSLYGSLELIRIVARGRAFVLSTYVLKRDLSWVLYISN